MGDEPATNPQVSWLTAHNLAYAIYTSGSTGKPTGVLVEHTQVTRLFDATASWHLFKVHTSLKNLAPSTDNTRNPETKQSAPKRLNPTPIHILQAIHNGHEKQLF
ncbi:hypothetical protein KVV02_002222 [Mortierella alpina]|uniref:AMP-dependent synthetase/ligase domain-containing protein n=1 Tax=Mortierella alpina TaxID=64518 RepID=A0A9P8A4J6_MORAP|nr:hypothetical protein KVV02_002222 [Mortierella alpina]